MPYRSFVQRCAVLICFVVGSRQLDAVTLTIQTNRLGSTPSIVAYNSGHFVPGSNTRDWWNYANVNGARVFITPSLIEPSDDLAPVGDGVTDLASFLTRRSAVRADPLNLTNIYWPTFTNNFGKTQQHGSNILNPTGTCAELRQLGIQILCCLSASESRFPIVDDNDWAGKWELWQHYYAEAFYLGRYFDVSRYQMYNEPNLADSLTIDDFLLRLRVISDAVQCAIADVNARYGKALMPKMYAPVSAGTASSTYNSWGRPVVSSRHIDFQGQTNAAFSLIQHYDYHEYNSAPANFGGNLASLNNLMTADMSPEPRYPTAISEFNVHTAGTFDTMVETLDTPSQYSRFGSIVVNLTKNFIDDLYCFKFSQTLNTTSVKKNGMLFVDNTNAPYNIGGITKAGEVYRLFAKSHPPGLDRLNVSGSSTLDISCTRNVSNGFYYLFVANNTTAATALSVDVSALNVPLGQQLLLEEVSENIWGAPRGLVPCTNNLVNLGTQPSNSVWLLSIPTRVQQAPQTLSATADAMAGDGTNVNVSFGSLTNCVVRNHSITRDLRSAGYIKFHLPLVYSNDVQAAVLVVKAASLNGGLSQAHVYGLTNTNWSQNTITWANGPNLLQNVAAGISIANRFLSGQGDGLQLAGELTADGTPADRYIDVTKYIRTHADRDPCFLIAREVRFYGDPGAADGLSFATSEAGATNGPRLILVRSKDTDNDGLSDESEVNMFSTNPNNADTDGDGFSDGQEVLVTGTNPGTSAPVAPSFSSQPASQSVLAGRDVDFSVSVSGTPPIRFQWLFNGNPLANQTNAGLNLLNVQTNQAGVYSVIASNAAGAVPSSNALLVVDLPSPPPLPIVDGFNYASGSALAGQNGWTLNGGSGGLIDAGSLSYSGLSESTGNHLTWGSASMSLRLPLNTNITSGQVYFSFILRVEQMGSSFTGTGTLAGFTTGTTTTFGTKVNIRPISPTTYNLGTSKGGGTGFGDWAPFNCAVGDQVFVVGRYTFNAVADDDSCDLWVNPPASTFGDANPPPPTIAGVGPGGNDLPQIDRFFFRAGGVSSSPSALSTDELRLGFTWRQVTVPASPRMAISAAGSQLTFLWPTNSGVFQLQTVPDLDPFDDWTDVAASQAIQGTNYQITMPVGGGASFFRLKK